MSLQNSNYSTPKGIRGEIITLLGDLHGDSLEHREVITQRLKGLDRQSAIIELRELLAHPEPNLRCDAAEALLLIDAPSTVGFVLPLLKDPVDFVRWNVCYWLSEYPNSQAVEPLTAVLLHDQDSNVRFMTAIALGVIGDIRAVPALKWANANDFGLDHEGDSVSNAAAQALKKIGSQDD
ncbi:MAG: HEAT repeat domain-containing protein [Nitrososphaera sp.]